MFSGYILKYVADSKINEVDFKLNELDLCCQLGNELISKYLTFHYSVEKYNDGNCVGIVRCK